MKTKQRTPSRKALAQRAMLKSIEVRTKNGYDLVVSPICIYDLCDKLGIKVRFVDINMEGLYIRGRERRILLSALRPLVRRNYTCAHEVGHDVFGHGSTIDKLVGNLEQVFDPDEFLVDVFAGFLLMPTLGVRKEFASRDWDPATATPLEVYTVACSFGVGYETLIAHMAYSLHMISRRQATALQKHSPKGIRQQAVGDTSPHPLIIADEQWGLPTIDGEVGTPFLLPAGVETSSDVIVFESNHRDGWLFRATRSGIVRVYKPSSSWAVFVRISRFQFVGLSQYRHLEEVEEDE